MSTSDIIRRISFLAILLLTGKSGYSQTPSLLNDSTSYISAGISSDAFLSLEIAYLLKPAMRSDGQSHYFYGGIQLPVLLNLSGEGNSALKIFAGNSYDLLASDRYSMGGEIRVFTAHHKNVLGNFIPFGCDFSLSSCFMANKYSFGVYMTWSNIFATYIKHSEYSRSGFSDLPGSDSGQTSPLDGWYSDTGSILKWGVNSSHKVGPKMVMAFDLALLNHRSNITGYLDAMMIGQIPLQFNMKLICMMNSQ